MSRLDGGDLTRMALRASALQATWNYERQQGLGWAWALEPALGKLYPAEPEYRERLAEHTAYFNTQPTLASIALGAVARLEERRATGEPLDGAAIARIKGVLGASLAAFGDRLFWFSLRPFAALLAVMLVAAGMNPLGASLVLVVVYNLAHQGIRLLGTHWGYRRGPEVLDPALRARLQAAIRMLGIAGTALIGMLIAVLLLPDGRPRPFAFQMLFAGGLGFGLLVARRSRPSPTEWALAIGALALVAAWAR
jgi:PTS system mannose-specific IID component